MCSTPFAARCVAGYARGVMSNCLLLFTHSRMPPLSSHQHIARFPLAFPVREQYENAEYQGRVNAGFPLARPRVPASPRACPACPHVLPMLRPYPCPVPSPPRVPVPVATRARESGESVRTRAWHRWRALCAVLPSLCGPVAPCAVLPRLSRPPVPSRPPSEAGRASMPVPARLPHSAFLPILSILTLPTNPGIATPPVMTCGSTKALVRTMPPHVFAGHSVDVGTGYRNNGARYGRQAHNSRSDAVSVPDSDIWDNALTCNDSHPGTGFRREKDSQNPSHKYLKALTPHFISSLYRDR